MAGADVFPSNESPGNRNQRGIAANSWNAWKRLCLKKQPDLDGAWVYRGPSG